MPIRIFASLILLLFISSAVAGQNYFGGNNNSGYLSHPSDTLAPSTEVFIAFEDSAKEKSESKPVYSPALGNLEPRGINVEAERKAVTPGSISSPNAEEKLDYFAAYDKGFGIFP